MDAFVHAGLVGLLVASTLNGLTFDWRVMGREITIRPDHIALLVVLPLLVLAWLVGRLVIRLTLFDYVVLGFLLINFVSSLLSTSRTASLQAAVLLAAYGALYFVTQQILANRAQWLAGAGNWVLGLGVAQAVYSLMALLLFSSGFIIGGLQIGHLTERSVATKGTLWEANLLGAYLAFIAVFLTVRYVLERNAKRDGAYLLGLLVVNVTLPLTLTRAAALALCVGLSATALIVWLHRTEIPDWKKRAGRIAAVYGCAALLTLTVMNALVSGVSGYPNLLVERWVPLAIGPPAPSDPGPANATTVKRRVVDSSQSSAEGRMQAWSRALELWRDRPILGHGTVAGASVVDEGWWYSSLVQALYDTGLVGFLLLSWIHIAAVAYPLGAWRRARQDPMSATLLGFSAGNAVLVFTSQFSNSFFVGLPWVFLGVSMGAVAAHRRSNV